MPEYVLRKRLSSQAQPNSLAPDLIKIENSMARRGLPRSDLSMSGVAVFSLEYLSFYNLTQTEKCINPNVPGVLVWH